MDLEARQRLQARSPRSASPKSAVRLMSAGELVNRHRTHLTVGTQDFLDFWVLGGLRATQKLAEAKGYFRFADDADVIAEYWSLLVPILVRLRKERPMSA